MKSDPQISQMDSEEKIRFDEKIRFTVDGSRFTVDQNISDRG